MEDSPQFEPRSPFYHSKEALEGIHQEIQKIIVGQDRMIHLLLASLLAKGHVLLEGNPGLAKTLTAKLFSRCLNVDFKRIQFTPDLMPTDVLGTTVFNMKTSEFEFKPGPVFSNIILIDEINRAPAKTQSALFELMEERQVTVDGRTYHMPEPFLIIATQNPIDMEGTYRLPEAQMDRFLMKIRIPYPSAEEEMQILQRANSKQLTHDLSSITPILSPEQLMDIQATMNAIRIEDDLLRFIADMLQKTRTHPDISLGASPRAGIALLQTAKALAILQGRDFVIPDDILEGIKPVFNHRIQLTPEKEMEGSTTDHLIDNLIKSLEIPR